MREILSENLKSSAFPEKKLKIENWKIENIFFNHFWKFRKNGEKNCIGKSKGEAENLIRGVGV